MHRSIVDLSGEVDATVEELRELSHGITVESALYFTALEALSNAAKYASSSAVEVSLVEAGGIVELRVAAPRGPADE